MSLSQRMGIGPAIEAHETPAFKIKETLEVEALQKALFTDTLDTCAEETQDILSRGFETDAHHRRTPSLTPSHEHEQTSSRLSGARSGLTLGIQ
ncbi:hypothetical protein Nmel_004112 [Mimus melanotis]